MTSASNDRSGVGAFSRRGLLLFGGSAVAVPALAGSWQAAAQQRLAVFAQELGLTGLQARSLMDCVARTVGPQRMWAHQLVLLRRMDACAYAVAEMVDMLRMWARDDFAQERTTVVEGVRFADTELALFALVQQS